MQKKASILFCFSTQGYPWDQKSKKKRLILTPKICKKRPASRFVFQRFWVGKSEAQYQKRASIPSFFLVRMQCNAMQYNTLQNAMSCSVPCIRCPRALAMPHAIQQQQKRASILLECNAMQCNAIQYTTIQCNAMQCNGTAQRQKKRYVMLRSLHTVSSGARHAIQPHLLSIQLWPRSDRQLQNAMQCNTIP